MMQTALMLRSEILNHYRDSFGFLDHCKRDPKKLDEPVSGNGQLYMAEAYVLLKRLENGFMNDFLNYCNALSKARVEAGLYHRHPLMKTSLDQHDNIIGRVILKYMFGTTLDEWEYAQKHKKFGLFYSFNNLNPDDHAWNTVLLPHNAFIINFCAGKYWGIINTLAFIGMVLTTPYKKHKEGNPNTGVRIMGWMHLQPLVKRFKFMQWVERWYWKESNLTICAEKYFGSTPWAELFKNLEMVVFK